MVNIPWLNGLIGGKIWVNPWVNRIGFNHPFGEDFAAPSTVGSPIFLRVLKIPLFQTGGKTGFYVILYYITRSTVKLFPAKGLVLVDQTYIYIYIHNIYIHKHMYCGICLKLGRHYTPHGHRRRITAVAGPFGSSNCDAPGRSFAKCSAGVKLSLFSMVGIVTMSLDWWQIERRNIRIHVGPQICIAIPFFPLESRVELKIIQYSSRAGN